MKTMCGNCGKGIKKTEGGYACENCGKVYARCDRCEKLFDVLKGYTNSEGTALCPECVKKAKTEPMDFYNDRRAC